MAKCKTCGKGSIFLHLNSDGICPSCEAESLRDKLKSAESQIQANQATIDALQAKFTPEMLEADLLAKKLQTLNLYVVEKEKEAHQFEDKIRERTAELAKLQSQIISVNDTLELESYSLYEPKYDFAYSEEYKRRLDIIRDAQKQMIRLHTASITGTEWSVNGSAAKGRKFSSDNAKILLRSFNNECDAAIAAVKFSNFDRCLARINKSFSALTTLGVVSQVFISEQYRDLKIEELRLVHEYALKKQAEKEEQAEIRREQRELAKLEKEIAEARKAAEKEKNHYEKALMTINAQLAVCTDPSKLHDLFAKRQEIENGIADIQLKLEDIDYRQSNQRAGYVYIISNLGAFGENVYKIGMTRRLDPMERVHELGDASVPFKFDVHAMIFSADAPALEAALHRAFDNRRLNKVNRRREYFRVTLDEIKEVVRANHDKTVEFKDTYTAEQYRESLRM